VSMPADFALQALSDMLTQYTLDYPEVQLELDLSPRRVDLIAEGFDIAVRMGALGEDSQLAARRLAVMSNGLYASPDYLRRHGEPLRPEALESMHGLMILNRHGEAMPWQLRRGEPVQEQWSGVPAQRSLVNAPDMLLRMACAGVGITAVGDHYARASVAAGQLVRVLPAWCLAPVECWAVFPERRLMPLRSRLFIEAMATALAGCSAPVQPPAAAA